LAGTFPVDNKRSSRLLCFFAAPLFKFGPGFFQHILPGFVAKELPKGGGGYLHPVVGIWMIVSGDVEQGVPQLVNAKRGAGSRKKLLYLSVQRGQQLSLVTPRCLPNPSPGTKGLPS